MSPTLRMRQLGRSQQARRESQPYQRTCSNCPRSINLSCNARRHLVPAASLLGASTSVSAEASIAGLYTSQAYTHRRIVGPVQLEVVPGKGIGWRASRDIATGELLLASLPVAVLYGNPGDPPDNAALAEALRLSWPRLPPLERRWLLLLADCCATTSNPPSPEATTPSPAAAPASISSSSSLSALQASRQGTAAGGQDGRTAAESSAAADGSLTRLLELLSRARALVQEGQQPQQQQQLLSQPEALQATLQEPLPPQFFCTRASSGSSSSVRGTAVNPSTTTATTTPSAHVTDTHPLAATAEGPSPQPGHRSHKQPVLPQANPSQPEPLLLDFLGRYSYGEPREDPAVAELQDIAGIAGVGAGASADTATTAAVQRKRERVPMPSEAAEGVFSVAGLWPEAALLNHSCAPNCSVLLVGGAAYVRAGRRVLEGEELTLSYLGVGIFQDVAERRSQLRRTHGFLCGCPRCRMEQEHFPTRRYPGLERQLQAQRQQQQQLSLWLQQQTRHAGHQQHQYQQQLTTESLASPPDDSPSADQPSPSLRSDPTIPSSSSSSIGIGTDPLLMPQPITDEDLAPSLVGRRSAGGRLQRLLDTVFGPGRFTTRTAPDHRLLRNVNTLLVSELQAAVHAALTAATRPRQQQAELMARLEAVLAQVDGACNYLDLPPRGRLLTYGSVYGLVRLSYELAELLSGTQTQMQLHQQQQREVSSGATDPTNPSERRLQLTVLAAEVLEAVVPGSDAHVMAAVKAAGVARRVHGADSSQARRAELAAATAHLARYGRELLADPGLLRQLAASRRRQATGSAVAASMGVLAWTEHTAGDERF